jgi:nucleoside-diphosphate-sugar epimerase/uncharacterized membrane protein
MQSNVIVVTGSSGLIGSAVAARFAKDFHVVGFDRQGPPHPPPEVEWVSVDMTSDESVQKGLRLLEEHHGVRLAAVIHLAAFFDFSGEPNPLYETVTVQGTQRLLNGLKRFQVEQFIFSSTMLVHAPCEPGQRINEDWPMEPKWAYPESKVKTEALIRAERGSMPVVLLRIAGVYDDRCHSIPLAHHMQRIYERHLTSHLFPGHLSHGQSFIHLDDLIDAFALAVEGRAQLSPELTLLLGEPETVSYDELQHQFGRLIHGEEWETAQIPKPVAKTGAWVQDTMPLVDDPFIKPWMIKLADDHYALDISRARSTLGWAPTHTLRETLPKMVSALKADPVGWYREHKLTGEPAEVRAREERAAPPGWSYNPSSWSERLWIIAVALLGFGIALYLALYQWALLADVWEPFFGKGSEQVLHSAISRLLPIPDAALGAFAYLLDAVAGAIGGRRRWRTMPWMVVLFGVAVGPLGIVSVVLVIVQPVLLQAWCTLCLVSAVLSLVMIGPAMDEVLASLQHLRRVHDRGESLWQAFWGRAHKGIGKL